ncbi:Hypothetical predicted protein [Olea europaea subsp. europaea]|uniref:Uncharacterized protein n=1 Tax=Olea europaea subsp. europaea TaxID=158383 RepID=A0A8S0PRV6_OLEEU|nr:Hypothetical predicted protein [Olea europaea subsp. europaea]
MFDTLALNKTVLVNPSNGVVAVDGVVVDGTEVYHNRWIVVVSVMKSLDDISAAKPPNRQFPASISAEAPNSNMTGVPSPADTPVGSAVKHYLLNHQRHFSTTQLLSSTPDLHHRLQISPERLKREFRRMVQLVLLNRYLDHEEIM